MNLFSKTRLTNKDIVYLLDVKKHSPINWIKHNVFKPEEVPYKNSTLRAWSFKDMGNIRAKYLPDTLNNPKKVIAFYSIKGGVGKTTASSQLAFLYSLLGFKVLAVDLDHQEDLTFALGVQYDQVKYSFSDIVSEKVSYKDAIIELNDNLHVLGANESLDDIESIFLKTIGNESLVSDTLANLKADYDIIILDCHPAKSLLNTSAVYASDLIVIPAIPDLLGYRGIARVTKHISEVFSDRFYEGHSDSSLIKEAMGKHVKIIPIAYNMIEKKHREYLAAFQADFPGMITHTLRKASLFSKAYDFTLSIFNIKTNLEKITDLDGLVEKINNGALIGLNTKNSVCDELKTIANELLLTLRN